MTSHNEELVKRVAYLDLLELKQSEEKQRESGTILYKIYLTLYLIS